MVHIRDITDLIDVLLEGKLVAQQEVQQEIQWEAQLGKLILDEDFMENECS